MGIKSKISPHSEIMGNYINGTGESICKVHPNVVTTLLTNVRVQQKKSKLLFIFNFMQILQIRQLCMLQLMHLLPSFQRHLSLCIIIPPKLFYTLFFGASNILSHILVPLHISKVQYLLNIVRNLGQVEKNLGKF